MAWIESHEEMGEHRKTHKFCQLLNTAVRTGVGTAVATGATTGVAAAVGHLHLLWHYTLRTAWETGDLNGKLPEAIAKACWWNGDPDVFINALIESGYIDRDMKVHQWTEYAAEIIYQRQYNRDRRKNKKSSITAVTTPVQTPVTTGVLTGEKTQKSSATIPYHTIPKEEKSCSYGENQKEENQEPELNTESCLNTIPPLDTESLKNKHRQAQRDQAFEEIWARYPDKTGRKAAYRHFMNSVHKAIDWENINKALDNYLNSERVSNGFVQNGSTWFNNWADWVERNEPVRV